ncbi:MAG: hypothetical protein CSA33_09385 [Desulfobulbus propionicus]|nr:MAG: hypothetical protein CSA33_09385 [Desulfobulbus propionicus]
MRKAMYRYRLLIVDDDVLLQNSLRNVLSDNYDTLVAGTGQQALEILEKESIDLVLLDIRLPGMNGLETLRQLKKIEPDLLVVMMTAYEDIDTVITSMKSGAHDFLVKPLEIEMLELIIDKALETLRLKKEVELLRSSSSENSDLPDIVAESREFCQILEFADKIAASHNTTVLIDGESGVGKEVVARIIHHHSSRFDQPFIGINCGAINKDLLESELFGYAKGTFTDGLQHGKKGKIELANNGTMLLDEISEMRPSAQVKLLRFLEEREFYPVGGVDKKQVDVRIIAATNTNLEEQVAAGSFREDLYYRLNVARISIPPLRQRKDDILPLALFFIDKYNEIFRKKFQKISDRAQKILLDYPWQGNIRELKNVMERVVLMENCTCVRTEHLGFLRINGRVQEKKEGSTSTFTLPPEGIDLEECMQQLIIQALERSDFNRTQAARLLGISRPTLTYRIGKYGINI